MISLTEFGLIRSGVRESVCDWRFTVLLGFADDAEFFANLTFQLLKSTTCARVQILLKWKLNTRKQGKCKLFGIVTFKSGNQVGSR